jgi:hypothetical protein
MFRLVTGALSLMVFCANAAPYDNLAAALTQQKIVSDLRTQCDIRSDIPDEKVRAIFIASKVNHHALSAAASALQEGKKAQYQQQLNTIRCPDFSRPAGNE